MLHKCSLRDSSQTALCIYVINTERNSILKKFDDADTVAHRIIWVFYVLIGSNCHRGSGLTRRTRIQGREKRCLDDTQGRVIFRQAEKQ